MDRQTANIPDWEHAVCRVVDDTPPGGVDVLHKVGWLKHQAFELLGPSLVLDLDAFPEAPLDSIPAPTAPIAMVPDPGELRIWPWAESWPAAARKYNAGVLWLNSEQIAGRFQQLWQERCAWLPRVTYFDEVIFSALMFELGGLTLPDRCNHQDGYAYGSEVESPMIRHFSGIQRKDALTDYVTRRLNLSARRL
jgi:hypothetical protein